MSQLRIRRSSPRHFVGRDVDVYVRSFYFFSAQEISISALTSMLRLLRQKLESSASRASSRFLNRGFVCYEKK